MSTATTITPSTAMSDAPTQPAQRFGSRLTENFVKDTSPPQYLCGSCGTKNNLVSGERVSCKSCGYKILYKARQREGDEMVAHNNPIQSAHLRKKWQFHVQTWFDQPAQKQKRAAVRASKAKKVYPKPTQKLRPVVRCQTNKYNTKARAGRGFTPAEVTAAGMNLTCCRTYGIAVDFRRRNASEEGFKVNVDRLKAYKSKLVIFPVKGGKARKHTSSEAEVAAAKQFTGVIMPVVNTVPVEKSRAPTAEELANKGKVVNMMRQALMAKKLYGRRINKVQKQQANKAAADKKAAKNAD